MLVYFLNRLALLWENGYKTAASPVPDLQLLIELRANKKFT